MAMGKRPTERQQELFIVAGEIPEAPGHPFYRRLNQLLAKGLDGLDGSQGFDAFVEGICRKFYDDEIGRPSIAPGVYFRMLLIGYFEGIDSERGIAWRCDDSRTLRDFLGCSMTQQTPDHSSLSRIRQRIDIETHKEVFGWVLKVLAGKGLLKGKTIGIDATTLEANAAMRSIVRRDSGESYNEFLTTLAKAGGIETPTREDLSRIDRNRKNKGSNDDWTHPHDDDARIARMKDGSTHLAHKAEHAVDLDTGAIVAVTLQHADQGDTSTLWKTMEESVENMREVADDLATAEQLPDTIIKEVVADKGYHSNATCRDLKEAGVRTYLPEKDQGRRVWTDRKSGHVKSAERDAVYSNRRRTRGRRGKALLRKRGELLERPFAHCYETGGMRRTHLRHHGNILKRLLVHVAGFNLALVMRAMFGIGKPRRLQDGLAAAVLCVFGRLAATLQALGSLRKAFVQSSWPKLARQPEIRTITAA